MPANLDTPVDELEVSVATSRFLGQLGVATLGDLLATPRLRAPRLTLSELELLFQDLAVDYLGKFEIVANEIPSARRRPCARVSYDDDEGEAPVTRVGGQPSAWSDPAPWPACAGCGRPLRFVAQIVGPVELGPVRLAERDAVQIFSCLHDDTTCRHHDGASGASVALRRAVREGVVTSPSQPFEAFGVRAHADFDDAILLEPEGALDDAGARARELAFEAAGVDKLGGIVAAGHDPPPATCDACGAALELLAQLGRGEELANPTGDATWIVRVCPGGHAARVDWVR